MGVLHDNRAGFISTSMVTDPPLACLNPLPQQRIFPYVLAMVGNGSLTYDHERDGRPTELGGCTAVVRNLQHDTFLFIRYVRRRLTVRFGSYIAPPG